MARRCRRQLFYRQWFFVFLAVQEIRIFHLVGKVWATENTNTMSSGNLKKKDQKRKKTHQTGTKQISKTEKQTNPIKRVVV